MISLRLRHSFHSSRRMVQRSFQTVDPVKLGSGELYTVPNLVNGEWKVPSKTVTLPDPLNGNPLMKVADTTSDELPPFVDALRSIPKSGLHNPFKQPERYVLYGAVCAKAAAKMREPEVFNFFVKLIQRVAPKSDVQAAAELNVTIRFLENFSADQVRFLARAFQVPGDHTGQLTTGYRWPYGGVALICPFNFPIEIPTLQLMGALFMGNRVTMKCDTRVAIVMEQMVRLLHECGMPKTDVDVLHADGAITHEFLMSSNPRLTQFTGSTAVAERLARDLAGKVKLEDAGWDWKILGPDVSEMEMVAFTSDQDAYAYSGQKCSAQSVLFAHENWVKAGFLKQMEKLAARRKLDDFTIGPVLTVTTSHFLSHVEKLLEIPGAELLFGGKELKNHTIPDCYGAVEPTAVKVPLSAALDPKYASLVSTEIFGPFQVVIEYGDHELDDVLQVMENTEAHLTAAIVSRDIQFQNYILANTVNGTTYSGIRARTTGAPQNHWFGPAGDPRAAGIGTPEAIKMVWSCHREVIYDQGPIAADWTLPKAT